MNPPDTQALIAERLRARRQRVALIRKRVIAIAAVTFALVWGVIFTQIVTAHGSTTTAGTGASSGSANTSTAAASSSSAGSSSPSTITTSQS